MKDKEKLNDLSPAQLTGKLNEFIEEARNLRFSRVVSSLDNLSRIKYVRKNIARIKTLLKEYEIGLSEWKSDRRVRIKNKKVNFPKAKRTLKRVNR